MKLGMLTACLPNRSLEEIAEWAADSGFEALEVACGGTSGTGRSRPRT